MALSTSSVWEVRTAGDDTNGGGFVTGAAGTDYSQQDVKNSGGNDSSTTDAVANGTSTITSATASFQTTIVGNIIHLSGGSAPLAAGWYQVTARASTTSITVDRNVAAGTGITMNIGGALASLGMVGSFLVSLNVVHIKTGTYLITSATPNVSGGCFSSGLTFHIEGYQATRGDLGTKPLLQASGISTFTIIVGTGIGASITANLRMDGAGLTASRGTSTHSLIYRCDFENFTNSACSNPGSGRAIECSGTGCSTATVFLNMACTSCVAYNNTITGFNTTNAASSHVNCISANNTGATSDGFVSSGSSSLSKFVGCVSYGNGRDGFRIGSTLGASCINCIAESNVGSGFLISSAGGVVFVNCAAFDNATDFNVGANRPSKNVNPIIGTGSFFTNAAAGDFSLNSTAGGGADLRAASSPGIYPLGLTTSYLDIGVAQHQDSGGGGSSEHSTVF